MSIGLSLSHAQWVAKKYYPKVLDAVSANAGNVDDSMRPLFYDLNAC